MYPAPGGSGTRPYAGPRTLPYGEGRPADAAIRWGPDVSGPGRVGDSPLRRPADAAIPWGPDVSGPGRVGDPPLRRPADAATARTTVAALRPRPGRMYAAPTSDRSFPYHRRAGLIRPLAFPRSSDPRARAGAGPGHGPIGYSGPWHSRLVVSRQVVYESRDRRLLSYAACSSLLLFLISFSWWSSRPAVSSRIELSLR
jgi:hypothetical protein